MIEPKEKAAPDGNREAASNQNTKPDQSSASAGALQPAPEFCSGFGQYHSENHETDPKPYVGITFDDIVAMVSEPPTSDKAEAQWAIFSTLKSRKHDEQRQHGQFHVLWADVDDPNGLTFAEMVSRACVGIESRVIAYTSRSATEEMQKARILIPLASPVSGERFIQMQTVLNNHLDDAGITPDRATERAGQVCYLPNRGDYWQTFNNGHVGHLNPSAWDAECNVIAERQKAAERSREAARHQARLKAAERMASGCKSPIDAFNEAYDLPMMLDSCGYLKKGDRWLSPNSSSKTPGVSLTDDGRKWLSAHNSDGDIGNPTANGSMGDAFDLFTHYEQGGNRDAAIKAAGTMFTTPTGETITAANQRAFMQAQGLPDYSFQDAANDQSSPPPWSVLDLKTIDDQDEPQRFAVDPIMPCRQVTTLGADGGVGKSLLALQACAAVASGRPFLGLRAERGVAAFLSAEDDAPILRRRLRTIAKGMGLNADDLANLLVMDAADVDASLFLEVQTDGVKRGMSTGNMEHLERAIEDSGAVLVVIDNASEVYGANEIDRAQVRGFIRHLRRIAARHECSILLLQHIDKVSQRIQAKGTGRGSGYSGSTAWNNSVRSRLSMVPDTKDSRFVELYHEKANLTQKMKPIALQWTNGLLERCANDDAVIDEDESARHEFKMGRILMLIDEAAQRGEFISPSITSRANAHRILSGGPTYPAGLSRDALFEMLRKAQRLAHLVSEEYVAPTRKTKERWSLTDSGRAWARDVTCAWLDDLVPTAPTAPTVPDDEDGTVSKGASSNGAPTAPSAPATYKGSHGGAHKKKAPKGRRVRATRPAKKAKASVVEVSE